MLLPLKMISLCQNVQKSGLFAKFGSVLGFCSSFERFWGSLVAKKDQIVTKSTRSTRLSISVPLDAQFARRGSG